MKTVLLSAAVSMFIALFGTPLAIKTFSRRGYGQEIGYHRVITDTPVETFVLSQLKGLVFALAFCRRWRSRSSRCRSPSCSCTSSRCAVASAGCRA